MKRLLFIALLLSGCHKSTEYEKPSIASGTTDGTSHSISPDVGWYIETIHHGVDARFIVMSNHLFAVIVGGTGVGICEVTDASVILRTNQLSEKPYVTDSNYLQGFIEGSQAWKKLYELKK